MIPHNGYVLEEKRFMLHELYAYYNFFFMYNSFYAINISAFGYKIAILIFNWISFIKNAWKEEWDSVFFLCRFVMLKLCNVLSSILSTFTTFLMVEQNLSRHWRKVMIY